MSLTRGHSCVRCQQRKVRCDQQKPCSNCVRARIECRIVPPQPTRKRKKKLHEQELIEQLQKKKEALMTKHGVSFKLVLEGDGADLDADLESTASPRDGKSSDEEYSRPTAHHAFDAMWFPFCVEGHPTNITHLHPSAIQVFQLWQVYIINVNPLLKISHVPTLQPQILEAGVFERSTPQSLEALMFCVYFIAVKSMPDEEVQKTFGAMKSIHTPGSIQRGFATGVD
ncbi:hypothetical protein NUU61_002440 [Penicillium alfredii]|uniref:Zn(2)-C6 fungal-type domain-containing protein n=1 Tax=Penicillium alfredii TaxID=1506179 RepID=A0A9W9FRP9_9EURO|nr:uncharacterized protein NUU61_002440 [Penicillium alfredii]KAJ5105093.1 hypothetical protein NUU61_002440 [Penicillium alfredii]